VRAPVLPAWSAGPKADALRGLSTRDVEVRAIESLRRIMGVEPARVEQAWTHDWYADPFSRGAYSYVPAGGLWAREVLARPVEHTLYFAGEAIDLLGYGGTVHGAIASGRRAARQILGKE
jgi:monoamine oxidase